MDRRLFLRVSRVLLRHEGISLAKSVSEKIIDKNKFCSNPFMEVRALISFMQWHRIKLSARWYRKKESNYVMQVFTCT